MQLADLHLLSPMPRVSPTKQRASDMSANKTIARADADVSLLAGSPATPDFGGERSEQGTDAIAKALRKVYVDGAAAVDQEPGAAGQATPPMKDRDHMILHRELNKVLRNIQTER
jgi:hypothetical protein